MRRVDRSKVPPPDSLVGVNCRGQLELERAITHFAQQPAGKFEFGAYKEPDVVEALHELFHGKCAYCESSFKAIAPTDVEHFRPKGKVTECPTHPGYWWLATKWENLLASCIDCNRRRYQRFTHLVHDPLSGGRAGRHLAGKGNSFPILGPRYALQLVDDLDAEDAALIDPTVRDPKAHLVWVEEQELSLVGPRMTGTTPDPYGKHTYRIYGLNRQGLVEERTSRMRMIRTQIIFIEQMLDRAFFLPEPHASEQRDEAFEQYLSLYKLAEPDEPYSAMVEDLLERESERLMRKYEQLK